MIDNMHKQAHVLSYHIDIRDSRTGFWRTTRRLHPNYDHKTVTETKRFLWWTWEVEDTVITNESEARTKTRIEAIKEAVLLKSSGYDVQVYVRVEWKDNGDISTWLVWDRGEWAH